MRTVAFEGAASSPVLRTMWRSPAWFPRGLASVSSAVSLHSASNADVTAGRPCRIVYPAYYSPKPGGAWTIHGFKIVSNNVLFEGVHTENVFHPRLRFQVHGAHPVYGGPSTVVNPAWTGHEQVFGAATWITSGATSATLTVASSAGFQIGDRIRVIVIGGEDQKGTITAIPNATSITLGGTVTTTTGQVVCAFHPLVVGFPGTSGAVETAYMLNNPLVITDPALDKFFVAMAVEEASTHGTYAETPVQTWACPVDAIWYRTNNGAGSVRQDGHWTGASLGSDISAMTFPADPQSGANITAGGAGANIDQINIGIIWSDA